MHLRLFLFIFAGCLTVDYLSPLLTSCREGRLPRSHITSTKALQHYLDYTVQLIDHAVVIDDQPAAIQLIGATLSLLRSEQIQYPELLEKHFGTRLFWRLRKAVTNSDTRELIKHKYINLYKSYCSVHLRELANRMIKRELHTLEVYRNKTHAWGQRTNPYFLHPIVDCQTIIHGHFVKLTLQYFYSYRKACDTDSDP